MPDRETGPTEARWSLAIQEGDTCAGQVVSSGQIQPIRPSVLNTPGVITVVFSPVQGKMSELKGSFEAICSCIPQELFMKQLFIRCQVLVMFITE